DDGAGRGESADRSGLDVAGSAGGQFPTPRPRLCAETTLECRNHAGVLAAAAPKTACSVETTLACRDHGAGTVVSARRSGFDAAGRPSASRQVTGASQSDG